ncbi:MFS transporter, partial [Streptomyces sp. NPDC054835]
MALGQPAPRDGRGRRGAAARRRAPGAPGPRGGDPMSTGSAVAARPAAAARHRALALTCSVVGAAVVALDGTVLTVAQPVLQRDLGAGLGQVQWTSTGYLVAVAGLLVFAGRLGDRYGHRRV